MLLKKNLIQRGIRFKRSRDGCMRCIFDDPPTCTCKLPNNDTYLCHQDIYKDEIGSYYYICY